VKTAIALTVAILAQATGNVLLSKGMRQMAPIQVVGSDLLPLLLRVAGNPTIWFGVGLLLIFFLLYASALSWAELSLVLPATSFGYVLNVAFAYYFLAEPVSATRWGGTVLISIGVIIVSRSATQCRGKG
jgi:uncharacterized membrane protein